jgi:hypothetical protein
MARKELFLAAVLTVVVVLPVWRVTYPPLQDYPYHLVRDQIFAHYGDSTFDYRATFTRSFYPAPYVLADWLVAALSQAMPVTAAGKAVLSLYLALFPWSLLYLVRSLGPERTPLGLFGFALAYNWHFHMGFVSYVLSIPAALFALGYWWRRRRDLAWPRVAVLALLVLGVYLLHVYSFGILAFVLLLLCLLPEPRPDAAPQASSDLHAAPAPGRPAAGRGAGGRLVRTGVAFTPALVLLAGVVARNAARPAAAGPLLLFYGNLKRKALLAAGCLPSFSLAWETVLFAAGVALGLALAVAAWRRGRRPEWRWLVVAAALVVLFLALPDHVGRVFFISNRVPLYVLLIGWAALPVPAGGLWPKLASAGFALLVLLHVGTLYAVHYRPIDRHLTDYRAVLAEIPADARAAFRADEESMSEGRIAPAALFGGYHYLEAPGSRIPDLEHFVGTLRGIDYRRASEGRLSTASVGTRRELDEMLSRPWIVGPGGFLVVVGKDSGGRVAASASRFAFRRVGALGPLTVYRKGRRTAPAAAGPAEARYYATGYEEGFSDLAVYQDPARGEPRVGEGFVPVAHRGWGWLYRRSPAAAGPGSSQAAPKMEGVTP